MMDAAAAAYVALTASGTDTLLMAADHALRRELNRRISDDLIRLGIVQPGPAVTIADGTRASPGDLIICTRNDHSVEAGESGRTLANGDLLRIEAITAGGLLVRRALDADPRTGQRRWTDRPFLYVGYQDAELGYTVTDHAAQGRTVHTGLAVITGTEDRQHVYVALTRGTDANLAYVFTHSPTTADPAPGPKPAPELARYDKICAERAGHLAPATEPAPPGTALGVLSAVLDHDGQQISATQTRNQALADADHLAVLHAIWAAETTAAREQHYRSLLINALPPGHRTQPSHQARWLWRTLRAAELAGLDPARVLAEAVAERSGHHAAAARHQALAASYKAMEHAYRDREHVFAGVMADRADWEAATRVQRHLAVAADAELRRRHPGQRFTPLRSAESHPATDAQRAELALTPGQDIPEAGQWIKDLTAGRRTFAGKLASRQSQMIPAEDPDYGDLGQAFPAWTGSGKGAILQPPKPTIRPSARVLERVADRDADIEAGE